MAASSKVNVGGEAAPVSPSVTPSSKGSEAGGNTVTGPQKSKPQPRKPGAPARAGGRPTATSAKRIVLFSVVAAGSAVALRDFKRGTVPSIRVGVGVLFAGIFLSALADVIPEVAGPLGLLVLVGAFLLPGTNGEPSVGADLLSSVRSIAKK